MKKFLMLVITLCLIAPALTANSIKEEADRVTEEAKEAVKTTADKTGEALEDTAHIAEEKTEGAVETVKENLEYAGAQTKSAFEKVGTWFNKNIWKPIKNMFTKKEAQSEASIKDTKQIEEAAATNNL